MKKYPGADRFVACLGVKKGDTVSIIADALASKKAIEIIAEKCKKQCGHVLIDYNLPLNVSDEIPLRFQKGLRKSDIIILAASNSWYHAPFRRRLKHTLKKRVIECYGLKVDVLRKGALNADCEMVKKINAEFKKIIKKKRFLNLRSSEGMNFTAGINMVVEESGEYSCPGSGGNLPAGELSVGIIEKTARGNLIFDTSFDTFGALGKHRIELMIDNGSIVKVKGVLAREFSALLKKDLRLKNIAEIGIGTNPLSISGRMILEDEKALGAVHIGFGNNTSFGGKIPGRHYDGVIGRPTVYADAANIIHNGKIPRQLFSKDLSGHLGKFGALC